jgi:ketosteroid isomerase-like protein
MQGIDVSDVTATLDRFAVAYGAKDVEGVLGLISSDPDTVLVGTGDDEIRIGPDQIREQIERDLSQAEDVTLELGPVRVSIHGDVAWAFAEPTVVATVQGAEHRMSVRMTTILVVEDGQLLIRGGHLSVAFAGQEPGESFAGV